MKYDIVIVGGGILGTALAYQLAKIIDGGRITVLEQENEVAQHTSSRNTGVVHRPFYLDPETKGTFARCAQESYGFWKTYAATKGLPWREIGTLEVALDEAQCVRLEKYKQWSLCNGMNDEEMRLLSSDEVHEIEPNVVCKCALLCTTDTAVDFGAFTRVLKEDAACNGVRFMMNAEMSGVRVGERIEIECRDGSAHTAKYLVNCAGGGALKIAHMMGVAVEYADLNFRGEYLMVEGMSARSASRNIYSVPRHNEFPFLDPHYVVRADGRVEIGPTAVPVFGPYTYQGFGNLWRKMCERPHINKLRLLNNKEFLILCAQEWASAFSMRAMVNRVQKFLPSLQLGDCVRRGNAGVRGPRSLHILNYNSPGATGAPAYAGLLGDKIMSALGMEKRV